MSETLKQVRTLKLRAASNIFSGGDPNIIADIDAFLAANRMQILDILDDALERFEGGRL